MPGLALKPLIYTQLGVLVLVTGLLALDSQSASVSGLLGMIVMMLANAYFIKRLFGVKQPDFNPQKIIINFYLGEVGKLLILALATAVCAKFLSLTWWAYMSGVVVMQISMWTAPWWIKRGKQEAAKE
jgi:F0F1-type ATP synthase assembly protein I